MNALTPSLVTISPFTANATPNISVTTIATGMATPVPTARPAKPSPLSRPTQSTPAKLAW